MLVCLPIYILTLKKFKIVKTLTRIVNVELLMKSTFEQCIGYRVECFFITCVVSGSMH